VSRLHGTARLARTRPVVIFALLADAEGHMVGVVSRKADHEALGSG